MPLNPTSMSARLPAYTKILEDCGAQYHSNAERHGISPELFERHDLRYSLPLVYSFFSKTADREGIDAFALRGALNENITSIEEPYRNMFLRACTVLVCLQRYMAAVRAYNGRQTSLKIGTKDSWFATSVLTAVARESWNEYSDWSNITVPLALLREALGQSWEPSHIWLQSHCTISDLAEEQFPNTVFRTGQPSSGFLIPTHCLSWRMPNSIAPPSQEQFRLSSIELEKLTFERTVEELITPYISDSRLGLDQAAELTGLKKRSLQRRLAEAGTSFRDICTKLKIELAKDLLENTDDKIINISLELGYNDPSHFARAFKNVAGVNPRQYRRALS